MNDTLGRIICTALFLITANATPWVWADTVVFRLRGQTVKVEGNILAEDSLGNILLEGRDSQHFIISAQDILEQQRSPKPVPAYDRAELRRSLEEEFGPRFRVKRTGHYLIVYSCNPDYADEAGKLFERAYSVFTNYFRRKGGFQLEKLKQPLVAIICASREEYVAMISDVVGSLAAATAGIYSPTSNRMYMYDALGGRTGRALRHQATTDRAAASSAIWLLREQNVSVIIHEGIHQIAYNVGFHHRNVANPLWLVEGMAMYFESPDLDAKGGWRGVGQINRERLEHFRAYFPFRSEDSLSRLTLDDSCFTGPSAHAAYSEAWALTYYLARARTDDYMEYIKLVNKRPPLVPYTTEERLSDFRAAFGQSGAEMEPDFRRYMTRVVFRASSR